jgi:hypothetical protein
VGACAASVVVAPRAYICLSHTHPGVHVLTAVTAGSSVDRTALDAAALTLVSFYCCDAPPAHAQELSADGRLVTRSAFLRTEPVHGAPDVWVLVPALPNSPSAFNLGLARRLAARQALPLAEWNPLDPACAIRKPPVAPTPMRDPPQGTGSAGGGGGGGPVHAPGSGIPALGGGGGGSGAGFIPALGGGGGGGPGPRGGGPGGPRGGGGPGMGGGPNGGGSAGGGGGGYAQGGGGGGGSYGPGPGGPGGPGHDSNTVQVLAAVARVLRSKVATVPPAFGELFWGCCCCCGLMRGCAVSPGLVHMHECVVQEPF